MEFYIFLPMLGYDFEMTCAKSQGNRFRIDGEIDEKYMLQIIVSQNIIMKHFTIYHETSHYVMKHHIMS